MKVRIGVGASASTPDQVRLILDAVGEFGFDSIWWSEVLTQPNFDPLVALTWAAAIHPTLKLGTTMLLPGRNMVRLAKQLAGLDALSAGRLLVTFVPGLTQAPEVGAVGVPVAGRRPVMEQGLPLLRELLSGNATSHDSEVASFSDVTIAPLPVQQPLEFWLGGTAPRSLERCGRLGDGWLPSLLTPEQAVAGRAVIEQSALAAGRVIDPEHFGVSIGFSHVPLRPPARQRIEQRAGGQDLGQLVPVGLAELRRLLSEFIAVGFSKFVVRPMDAPQSWTRELRALGDAVLDLQT